MRKNGFNDPLLGGGGHNGLKKNKPVSAHMCVITTGVLNFKILTIKFQEKNLIKIPGDSLRRVIHFAMLVVRRWVFIIRDPT